MGHTQPRSPSLSQLIHRSPVRSHSDASPINLPVETLHTTSLQGFGGNAPLIFGDI